MTPLRCTNAVAVTRAVRPAAPILDGSTPSTVEVVAEELGASLRWATATTRSTRSRTASQLDLTGPGCWSTRYESRGRAAIQALA